MSLRGLRRQTVSSFRGPIIPPQAEVSDIPSDAAIDAQNVTYLSGSVVTREGHASLFSSGSAVRSMYNWTDGGVNRLLYLNGAGQVISRDLSTGVETVLMTGFSGAKASFATAGSRIYIAGGGEVRVWDGTLVNGNPNIFKICPAAPAATISGSVDAQDGTCTEGDHKIAFVMQSQSGSITPPSAATAVTFTADKRMLIQIQFAQTPAWGHTIYLLMTTATNLERYYLVPGQSFGVPPGVPWTFSFYVDIADETLAAVATEATKYFGRLSQDAGGNGPIQPHTVFAYGNRMVYVLDDRAYVSDPFEYEAITADRHVIELPGKRKMTGVFVLRDTLYFSGDTHVFSISDNGDYPVTWGTPAQVSSSIGVPSQDAISMTPDYGYVALASRGGVYYFDGGSFTERPLNQFQLPHWRRINWNAAAKIRLLDHVDSSRIFAAVPLDAATENSHIMVWDYSPGRSPASVNYSLDSISGYGVGSMEVVKIPATSRRDLVIGPSAAGAVLRRYSLAEMFADKVATRSDNGVAIQCAFEGAKLPTSASGVNIHRGVEYRLLGAGIATLKVVTLDGQKTRNLLSVSLQSAPDMTVFRRHPAILANSVSHRIEIAEVGGYFELSGYTHFYKAYLTGGRA